LEFEGGLIVKFEAALRLFILIPIDDLTDVRGAFKNAFEGKIGFEVG
jgi:hypothetical protein